MMRRRIAFIESQLASKDLNPALGTVVDSGAKYLIAAPAVGWDHCIGNSQEKIVEDRLPIVTLAAGGNAANWQDYGLGYLTCN